MTPQLTRLAVLAFAALACSNVDAATLEVVVSDIAETKGFVMLAMFDGADAFDNGGEPVRAARLAADSDEVSMTFEDLPPGEYAIKLYHDANGNGELDTNMLGLPKEGYGFSNDAGRFGAPPFAEAVFTVDDSDDNVARIRVR